MRNTGRIRPSRARAITDGLRRTLRITLPKKWRSGPAQRIKETFLEAYNKKKEKNLDPADFHLQTVMCVAPGAR